MQQSGCFTVRMETVCAALLGGAALLAGVAQAAKPEAPKQAPMLQLDFKAMVQADGTVTDIQPDPALPAAVQALIRQRVATWRYSPMQWQGKSQPSPITQTIYVQAVPTEQGGVVLRIAEVSGPMRNMGSGKPAAGIPVPLKFPAEVQRRGISAVVVYAVLYDEAGKPRQVDLLYPSELDRDYKRLDEAARDAIAQWVMPHTFDGAPISCRTYTTITFHTDGAGELPRVPPERMASFNGYVDRCPTTSLETPVAGTFL